ncbi:flocculation protein FLO11-like [Sphaeramia orbicularis]|uniref:flocculation protein FLO11-like n=1 Tax=Sphaeramia orbicularis TaxID=375764 RepID=UPI00117C35FB|nr:flocculation protein FLO11-like [Sphaeramia orbicularis]
MLAAGLPASHAGPTPPLNPHIGSTDTLLPSSFITPSSTPLPLELHIDEDGSAHSAGSTVVLSTSKSAEYSAVQEKHAEGSVTSQISHVESLSVFSTQKHSSEADVKSSTLSVSKTSASNINLVAKSPSPSTVRKSPGPVPAVKSPSPVVSTDITPNQNQPGKTSSPVLKSYSPVTIIQIPEAAVENDNPVPTITETVPKISSPVTVPRLSSPVPHPVPVPAISNPETVPKCASPVTIPRLSSPVPKVSSPLTLSNICSSPTVPKSSSPESYPKCASPVMFPRLSSPVTVPKSETAVPKNSPAVIRKTFTVQGTSSPRASPVSPAVVSSNTPSSLTPQKQGGDVLDLTWPCREPLLDDTLDKLLAPTSTQPEPIAENQPPCSISPGYDDRQWEEEDVIYPEFSREGTLTPMTESSWIDECLTPSTCPGTPDATLDLPLQQPSAVERLSACGQVGGSKLNSPKISFWHVAVEALRPHVVI